MFFFKQKTAYEMRISDWSSDVCSSDLTGTPSSSASHVSPSPACGRGRREAPGEGAAFDVAGQKPGPHPNPSPEGGRGATDRSISSARYATQSPVTRRGSTTHANRHHQPVPRILLPAPRRYEELRDRNTCIAD